MSEQRKNKPDSIAVDRIKEIYRDHPRMEGVNALKEQLKQAKLEDKVFCQSIKEEKSDRS